MENKEQPGFFSTAWDMLTNWEEPKTAQPRAARQQPAAAQQPQTLQPSVPLANPANAQKPKNEKPYYHDFLHRNEGFRMRAYRAPEGHYTVGPGLRFNPVTGKPIQKDDVMTEEEGVAGMRMWVEERVIPNLRRAIPEFDSLSESRRQALISFAFNAGENFVTSKGYETIRRHLQNKDWNAAADAMMMYNKHAQRDEKGNVIRDEKGNRIMVESKGLTNRRARERALMMANEGEEVDWRSMP